MYRTWQVCIRPSGKTKKAYRNLYQSLCTSKLVYNQALFYIRNLYSGLRKDADRRTENENTVILNTCRYICEINVKNRARGRNTYPFPSPENPVLSINLLVSVMTRVFRDHFSLDDSMDPKLVQNTVRQASRSASACFKAMKDYRFHPDKYLGQPGLPKYRRNPCFMIRYDNQMVSVKDSGKGARLLLGSRKRAVSIYLGSFRPEKLVEVQAREINGRILLHICYEDEENTDSVELDPRRILGIDLGVKNFAAVCPNFEATPLIINGGNI